MAAAGSWRVRDFHDDDLDAAVRLWDSPASSGEAPAFGLSDLIAAVRSHEPAEKVVVFIDEVEEIAGTRQPRTASAAQGVTNEMLKLIPPFREQDERLLICATNSVRALDIQSCARV